MVYHDANMSSLAPPVWSVVSVATNVSDLGNQSDHFNSTTDLSPGYSLVQVIIIAFVAAILSIVTAGGNLMVMISFKLDKQLQTVSNYFLLSLSVADFAIGVISMPLYTLYLIMDQWPLGPLVCDIWLSLDYTMSNASVANLLIICFDRYFSITRPLTYRAKRTPKRAVLMIALAWIISVLLWPPWIFAWPYIEGKRTVPRDDCYIQFLTTNQYITLFTAFLAFYLPVVLMCVLYFKIYLETQKRQEELKKLQANRVSSKKESEDNYIALTPGLRTEDSVEGEMDYELAPSIGTQNSIHKTRCQRWCMCCKIDRDTDPMEDSTSSDPPFSPSPSTTSQRISSVKRRDTYPMQRRCKQNGNHSSTVTTTRSAVPQITVDSPCSNSANTPVLSPSTDITGVSVSKHSDLSSCVEEPGVSTQSVMDPDSYTIVIRLSGEDKDAKPNIQMMKTSSCDSTYQSQDNINLKRVIKQQSSESDCGSEDVYPSELPHRASLTYTPSVGRRLTQTSESLKLAMQSRINSRLSTKVRSKHVRRKRQEKKQEQKAAKTLSAILLAFIVTWTPYNLFTVIQAFSHGSIPPLLYATGKIYIYKSIHPTLIQQHLSPKVS